MGVTGSPKAVPAGERLSAGEEDNSQSQRNRREIGVRDTQKSHAGWGWAGGKSPGEKPGGHGEAWGMVYWRKNPGLGLWPPQGALENG